MKTFTTYILIAIIGFLFFQCDSSNEPAKTIPIIWTQLDRFSDDIPSSVQIFYGENNSIPLKVWYASIDLTDTTLRVDIVSAKDSDHLESLTEITMKNESILAVNAGFFRSDDDSIRHIGLLKENNRILSSAIRSLIYKNRRYFTARGAIGISNERSIEITWVSERNDSLFKWPSPIHNSKHQPHQPFNLSKAKVWHVDDAVQAGPVLISDGKFNITADEEVFFHPNFTKPHPRTAAGITRDNRLILLVVDGRQIGSRGVYLEELAKIMQNLGCANAINLDGGGSTSMVVDGQVLNAPADGNEERDIMSAISVSFR